MYKMSFPFAIHNLFSLLWTCILLVFNSSASEFRFSPFHVCWFVAEISKTQVETTDALATQAKEYCQAAMNLYQHHLWHGYVLSFSGKKRYINGDITKLQFAEGLTATEKKLLYNLGFISWAFMRVLLVQFVYQFKCNY